MQNGSKQNEVVNAQRRTIERVSTDFKWIAAAEAVLALALIEAVFLMVILADPANLTATARPVLDGGVLVLIAGGLAGLVFFLTLRHWNALPIAFSDAVLGLSGLREKRDDLPQLVRIATKQPFVGSISYFSAALFWGLAASLVIRLPFTVVICTSATALIVGIMLNINHLFRMLGLARAIDILTEGWKNRSRHELWLLRNWWIPPTIVGILWTALASCIAYLCIVQEVVSIYATRFVTIPLALPSTILGISILALGVSMLKIMSSFHTAYIGSNAFGLLERLANPTRHLEDVTSSAGAALPSLFKIFGNRVTDLAKDGQRKNNEFNFWGVLHEVKNFCKDSILMDPKAALLIMEWQLSSAQKAMLGSGKEYEEREIRGDEAKQILEKYFFPDAQEKVEISVPSTLPLEVSAIIAAICGNIHKHCKWLYTFPIEAGHMRHASVNVTSKPREITILARNISDASRKSLAVRFEELAAPDLRTLHSFSWITYLAKNACFAGCARFKMTVRGKDLACPGGPALFEVQYASTSGLSEGAKDQILAKPVQDACIWFELELTITP